MNPEDYYVSLKDYWAYTLLEAVETLPKVLNNPQQAQREMNRLKRHCDYQLQETIRLTEEELA